MPVTLTDALAMLPDAERIHVLEQMPEGLIGFYRPRQEVLDLLKATKAIFPATGVPAETGHSLAALTITEGHAAVTFIGTGSSRELLHFAVGTYADFLDGGCTLAEAEQVKAMVPAELLADYADQTAVLREFHGGAGGLS